MDWLNFVYIGGSLCSMIAIVLFFRDDLKSKKSIRRFMFWLGNKSFFVKIKAVKTYPCFEYDIKKIISSLLDFTNRNNMKISFQISGKNYIQILFEGMQAPFFISFQPNTEIEQENSELPTEISISIRLLGEIEFKYKDDKNNKNYIDLIESIYRLIEKECGGIKANFEDYNIESTPYDFVEKWEAVEHTASNDSSIYIGNKVVQIHTNRLSSLYDTFKDNRTRYLNSSLFLNRDIHKVKNSL